MFGLVLSSFFCLAVVSDDKLTVPEWDGQLRATALLQDVYGEKLKAAKTAEQKSALGKDILRVAKEESDPANKYVGL